jgi:surface antigen
MSQFRSSRARSIALGTALVIGASVAAPAFAASNLAFMSNSPLAYLRKADNEALAKAANEALSKKEDNDTLTWDGKATRNPAGVVAQLTPTNTRKTGDKTCRDLIVQLNAKGQEVELKLSACKKGDDGRWELQKRAAP